MFAVRYWYTYCIVYELNYLNEKYKISTRNYDTTLCYIILHKDKHI